MRACASAVGAVLLFAASVLGQAGTGGTITAGDVTFTQADSPTDPNGIGPLTAVLNVGGGNAQDHLWQHWWWYRLPGGTRELAFANATSAVWAGNQGTLTYTNATFSTVMNFWVEDCGSGAGKVTTTLRVTNTSGANVTLNLFNYHDPDIAATINNDSATLVSNNVMRMVDGGGGFDGLYEGPGATAYAADEFSDLRTLLANASVTDFANTGLPFAPADFTGGYQYVVFLAAGQSATVTASFSIRDISPACCLFTPGDFDERGAQRSQVHVNNGGAIPSFDYRAADDFYLEPGYVYKICSVSGKMLVRSLVGGSIVNPSGFCVIYKDCNGQPGEEIGTFQSAFGADTGEDFMIGTDSYDVYELFFPTGNLILRGGSYWVSIVGVGNLDGTEEWYWGTAGDPPPAEERAPVLGHQGLFQSVTFGPADWTDSDEGCCGCTDYNFCLDGTSCKILLDNGSYDADGSLANASGSRSQVRFNSDGTIRNDIANVRAADQFVTLTCNDEQRPCYIEAYIYTNCVGRTGYLEIYDRECEYRYQPPQVDCDLPKNEAPLARFLADRAINISSLTGETVTIDGVVLDIVCLQFWNFGGFEFTPGRTYFASVFGRFTASLGERAYFAHNEVCESDCDIRFFGGATRGPGLEPQEWERLDPPHDFAFLVALDMPALPGSFATEVCAADFNRSGGVSVQDLFDFLSAYFQGCP